MSLSAYSCEGSLGLGHVNGRTPFPTALGCSGMEPIGARMMEQLLVTINWKIVTIANCDAQEVDQVV
jgi:hypothetical protein